MLILGCLGGLLAAAISARIRLVESGDVGASAALISVFFVFCVSAGVDWMWEETAIGGLAVAGVAVAAAGGSKRRRSQSRRGPLLRPGVRGVLVVLALAAAAVQIPGLMATERIRASQQAVRADDLPVAQKLAQNAVDSEPWAASPQIQLGLVLEREGRFQPARHHLQVAAAKEPTNWQIPLVLSRVEVEAGDRGLGRRTFRRGTDLAPGLPFYSSFSGIEREVASKHMP